MPKTPPNHRQPITRQIISQVNHLARGNTPTGIIALKIGRTQNSVRSIASDNDISLHPTNKPPYDRKVANSK